MPLAHVRVVVFYEDMTIDIDPKAFEQFHLPFRVMKILKSHSEGHVGEKVERSNMLAPGVGLLSSLVLVGLPIDSMAQKVRGPNLRPRVPRTSTSSCRVRV
ncbi:hypothetical protein MPTK1_5g11500 [Marchantia polymorpha subsp. ruderalis]|uniref:Uncharacterized protein n=2 Tax=Marchantia polymorpha TaxID=3197 RepID=A0AAF6BHA8_MARPO|nr:hypothetical protein MARPO_0093s0073 [Marchantia polymorpha]BBN11392.1 hypothetical protein Mp_5g11500 [Marchantia polymorpha subsp. ruderalis]|eukprot:PTQ33005.1 hypothetical protein MARPO_0093s0073 [Marchantia polymorpha]